MINAANVLIFWIRLHENGDESLIECALQRIFEHLEEVCKTKEFADLDLNQVWIIQISFSMGAFSIEIHKKKLCGQFQLQKFHIVMRSVRTVWYGL